MTGLKATGLSAVLGSAFEAPRVGGGLCAARPYARSLAESVSPTSRTLVFALHFRWQNDTDSDQLSSPLSCPMRPAHGERRCGLLGQAPEAKAGPEGRGAELLSSLQCATE